jgi:nitrite reductase (cytochrome c-552)
MLRAVLIGSRLAVALLCALASHPLWAQPAQVSDAVCLGCHVEPSRKFHSQPSHKKLACATCHSGGAQHVADTRQRPQLAGDERICASCHEAKKKHGARD